MLIDGIKLIFYRMMYGMVVLVVLMPIVKVLEETYRGLDYNKDMFPTVLNVVLMGHDFIYIIVVFGVFSGFIYMLYVATRKRRYEDEKTMPMQREW